MICTSRKCPAVYLDQFPPPGFLHEKADIRVHVEPPLELSVYFWMDMFKRKCIHIKTYIGMIREMLDLQCNRSQDKPDTYSLAK